MHINYKKILRQNNKDCIRNFGRYLDKIKYKQFNRTNVM